MFYTHYIMTNNNRKIDKSLDLSIIEKDNSKFADKKKVFKYYNVKKCKYNKNIEKINIQNKTLPLDPSEIFYKDSIGVYRIPRCSTGFDNRIPGYFNTNFGKILKNVADLYNQYGVKLFDYFDVNILDLNEIKEKEDQLYLNFFSKYK